MDSFFRGRRALVTGAGKGKLPIHVNRLLPNWRMTSVIAQVFSLCVYGCGLVCFSLSLPFHPPPPPSLATHSIDCFLLTAGLTTDAITMCYICYERCIVRHQCDCVLSIVFKCGKRYRYDSVLHVRKGIEERHLYECAIHNIVSRGVNG